FSAQINGITTTVQPSFERLTIGLTVAGDSAQPHATARCISAADDAAEGIVGGPGPYVLLLEMDDWLHDAAFRDSTISQTKTLSGTTVLKQLSMRFDSNDAAGATIAIGLDQPYPYQITFEERPSRLVLEIAKSTSIGPSSDMLSLANGSASP